MVWVVTTANMFTRWLAEEGSLPLFYQRYRDSLQPEPALAAAGLQDLAEADRKLRAWVMSHPWHDFVHDSEKDAPIQSLAPLVDAMKSASAR